MQAASPLALPGRCQALAACRTATQRPLRSKAPAAAAVNAQLGGAPPPPPPSVCSTSGRVVAPAPAAFGACLPSPAGWQASRAAQQAWLCAAAAGGDGGGSDGGSSGGSSGGGSSGGSSSSGGGGGEEEDGEEYLDLKQAEELAAAKGVQLPEDMAAAAGGGGLRASALEGYLRLATGSWLTAALVKAVPAFRDRLIADRLFFFKVWAEVAIDSGCATVAELRKRGDEFWDEFEFYLSDLLVGLVLDVVLVTLLAPPAAIGRSRAGTATGLKKLLGRLPSAVFEASGPGRRFTLADRAATYVKLGLEYSLAGIFCGFVGQGIANSLMRLKRHYGGTSDSDVAVPPLVRTALVWGMFMGLSSNSRYQVVFGLERLVDETVARRVPQIAYFTTLAIRFCNNVIGGENFIDMARWAGVQ